MALFSDISEANRVVSQGDTWTADSQLVFVYYTTSTANGVQTTTAHKVWKSNVRLAKRYAYVGMAESSAVAKAVNVADAYVQDQTKYALAYNKADQTWSVVSAVSVPVLQASVTPSRAEGNVWQIEVDVSAEAEVLTESAAAPSVSTLKAYLSSVANFPESSLYPQQNPGGAA